MSFTPYDTMGKTPIGLPRNQLVPGTVITISRNLVDGTALLATNLYEIVAFNDGFLLVRSAVHPNEGGHVLVPIHEHEFYEADLFARIVNQNMSLSEWTSG